MVEPNPPRTVAPMHPGKLFADAIEDANISICQAARAIDMAPNALSNVLNGESPVTPEIALRIARYLGSDDPEVWLSMQMDFDLWHARIAMEDRLAAIAPMQHSSDGGL
jgi:addiction module HigA family antidote